MKGRAVDVVSILMSITAFSITGIIMMILAQKAKIASLNRSLANDIDKHIVHQNNKDVQN